MVIAITAAARKTTTATPMRSRQNRSIMRPAGSASKEPSKMAHALIWLNAESSICKSRIKGVVIKPRPCVRPGNVADMATDATTRFTHP